MGKISILQSSSVAIWSRGRKRDRKEITGEAGAIVQIMAEAGSRTHAEDSSYLLEGLGRSW